MALSTSKAATAPEPTPADIVGAPVARAPRPHSGIADDASESDFEDDIDDDDLLAPVFT